MSDFEAAVWVSLKKWMLNVAIKGCRFHHTLAIVLPRKGKHLKKIRFKGSYPFTLLFVFPKKKIYLETKHGLILNGEKKISV